MVRHLIFIFGDQLSHTLTALDDFDPHQDQIFMCEVMHEATYVKHHKKKIAFIFSAMRHFAESLKEKSYNIHYVTLNDPDNTGSFHSELNRTHALYNPECTIFTEPSEYRVLQDIKTLEFKTEIRENTLFLATHQEFATWASDRKTLRMEYFYREMRKKYNILMHNHAPIGGQWNYDQENRKPPKQGLEIPETYHTKPDHITQTVLELVQERFSDHFGDLTPFHFAVTAQQAETALEQFIQKRLAHFGDYQDAMIQDEPWMFHSHLSFYINIGLLHPLQCIKAAEQAYYDERAPLNAVEGFIRQILGWREYIRGIYWLKMPDYRTQNFFEATRKLPELYWTGQTKMNCMRQSVLETKQNAYAHHIQRLMVLGNFALLAGIHPDDVNHWFLIVYADAYEWVELPNVSGMILFADGGFLASKPYAAGGSYINKMSDYCKKCSYKISKKNGADACPFNYLYWDFLVRNRDKLYNNHRIGMMYKTYDKMALEKKEAIKSDAARFLKALD